MTAPTLHPRGGIDPWTRTEQCRATAKTSRGPARCGNRAPSQGDYAGLCYRHRDPERLALDRS